MSELSQQLAEFWNRRPGIVVLVAAFVVVFLYLVIDAWRRKHPPRSQRREPSE